MTSFLYYQYYYKYADARKTIKNDLINENISGAGIKLTQYIIENDNYMSKGITTPFAVLDNMSLHHAKDHLNEFQNNTEQVEQKDATISALDE